MCVLCLTFFLPPSSIFSINKTGCFPVQNDEIKSQDTGKKSFIMFGTDHHETVVLVDM